MNYSLFNRVSIACELKWHKPITCQERKLSPYVSKFHPKTDSNFCDTDFQNPDKLVVIFDFTDTDQADSGLD